MGNVTSGLMGGVSWAMAADQDISMRQIGKYFIDFRYFIIEANPSQ